MITPPVDGQPGGANFPPGIIPPPDGGGYGYPPGTIPQGGNPYGTTPPGCFLQRNTQSGCIPGITQDGGDPGMFPGGGFGSGSPPPPAVLQGCGPGIIPYCGGPGSRIISGGSGSIHTMARSSIPTTIILSTLLVLSLHMTLSP